MPDNLGKRLFTYAVITDTHLNQGETECNSPYEVNKLANGRMRHVVRDLNRRQLEFVIHLGDLLHPVPAIPHLYERAAQCFKDQVADLRHSLYVVPGNHDVGDKPIDWGPAGIVKDAFLDLWKEHFGAHYQTFDHGDCRFILVDAQVINSGLSAEAKQKAWFEDLLAAGTDQGKRIFLNIHYPPYLTYADEDEHYDNIGEPGRSWLLDLMERYKFEALFAGHVHNFWYHRHGETDCYLLPSTAFVRHDYAEMYRAAPPPETEAGRNDAAKLGYFVVHVHEQGHLCEIVRTYGEVTEPGAAEPAAIDRVKTVHPIENPVTRFGFDMRQNWLEIIEIPPSGGLDEFDRKRTRNDYALMALIEMGVRRLRIPARDLLDPEHRARLTELAGLGFLFTLFTFGEPDASLTAAVEGARGLIDTWEIAQALGELPAVAAAAGPVAEAAGAVLYLSKLRSKDEMERGGEKYYHMINHGFTPDEGDQIAKIAELEGISGVVFRVAGETTPWRAAGDATRACARHGLKASLHIRMSMGSPGTAQSDEAWVSNRGAEALAAAAAYSDAHVYLDTFADVDRGYFVRQGVVDRLYNPRQAFHVLRHMNGALAAGLSGMDNGNYLPWKDEDGIILVNGENRRYYLMATGSTFPSNESASSGRVIDLLSGERVQTKRTPIGDFEQPLPLDLCLWVPDG